MKKQTNSRVKHFLTISMLLPFFQAPSDFLTTFKAVPDGDGLLRSKLGLNFRATRDYFRADHLRLRCAAALTLLYELKAVEYLIDGTKKHRTNAKRFTNGKQ